MKFIELSELDKGMYNHFVATQESGSFLQSWEWGEWQSALGREVFRFKISDENDNWLGTIQLIKMPVFGKYFYFYAPYGPVLDLRFKIEDLRFLTQELQKRFSDSIFIRIEPKDKLLSANDYPLAIKSQNIQPGKTLLVDLSKTEEQLLSEMHHKTRYNIKVAQKHGVEIKDEFDLTVGHGLFFDEALKLILQTSKRQNFKTFDESYYRKLTDFFALQNKNGSVKLHIYKAVYNNKLLSAAIIIDFSKTRTYLFGGSSDEDKNVMAPYLLHWQAMLDSKLQSMNFYDFWGIETSAGSTPGFVRFKTGFGGSQQEYGGAADLVINEFKYKMYKVFRKLNKLLRK